MLTAKDLYQILLQTYSSPPWWSEDPYRVMVEAVLVQNTSFRNVRNTTASLPLSPSWILSLSREELIEKIRPCGAYQRKSATLYSITRWYVQYHWDPKEVRKISTDQLRKELLSFRGIGEETADVILTYAFYRPMPIIDQYTRRFLSRLGMDWKDDDWIRDFFCSTLPQQGKWLGNFHWLILEHSILCCKKTPLCGTCPFTRDALCKRSLIK